MLSFDIFVAILSIIFFLLLCLLVSFNHWFILRLVSIERSLVIVIRCPFIHSQWWVVLLNWTKTLGYWLHSCMHMLSVIRCNRLNCLHESFKCAFNLQCAISLCNVHPRSNFSFELHVCMCASYRKGRPYTVHHNQITQFGCLREKRKFLRTFQKTVKKLNCNCIPRNENDDSKYSIQCVRFDECGKRVIVTFLMKFLRRHFQSIITVISASN